MDTSGYGAQKFASLAAHGSQAESIFFLQLGQERFTELMGVETFVRVCDSTDAPTPEDDGQRLSVDAVPGGPAGDGRCRRPRP